jgi:hypothetical protein
MCKRVDVYKFDPLFKIDAEKAEIKKPALWGKRAVKFCFL